MTVFKLTLQPTYYKMGFFNVTVDYDGYVRREEGPVTICLGDDGRRIEGTINRRANMNGTARILGGTDLRDWFQNNFRVMEHVDVELDSTDEIRLRKCGMPK